ncbi:MAG: hypothetical protein IPJ80_14280 [Saprospiraceae bacterium]|nr:hypothetical protein [Saprospiraceae bacterium]
MKQDIFEFKDLQNGSYYLKSTYVGMELSIGRISIQNNQTQDLGVLKMNTTPINPRKQQSVPNEASGSKPDRLVLMWKEPSTALVRML